MQVKKDKSKDVRRKRVLFFQIGLVFSIGISILAFSWQTSLSEDMLPREEHEDVVVVIDPTYKKIEKKQEEKQEEKEKVKKADPNKVKAGEPDSIVVFDPDPKPPIGDTIIKFMPDPEPPMDDDIFTVVQKMPQFPGGQKALDLFVRSNFNMPPAAADIGVDGRVYIEFIVDEKGNVSNVIILKDGIGWGCAEEAQRVVKLMAAKYKWTPGEQRNKKVKVRYRYPIDIKSK